MISSLNRKNALSLALAAATVAAALWAYASHRRAARPAEPVPVQDGKTIDFSGGSPAVKDDAASKAAMDSALKQIDEASRTVTFSGEPTPTK